MSLRDTERSSGFVTCFLSFALTLLLVYLIRNRTNNDLKAYSRMLIMGCFVDLLYASVTLCAMLQLEVYDGVIVYVIGGVLNWLPFRFHFVVLGAEMVVLGLLIATLPVQYYYRYVLISRGQAPSTPHLVKLMAVLIILSCAAGTVTGFAFVAASRRGIDYSYILTDPMWTDSTGLLAPYMAADIREWETLDYIAVASAFVCFCYGTALFYLYRTYAVLKTNENRMSTRTKKLQRQLTLALAIQTVVPLMAVCIPSMLILLSITFKLKLAGYGCALVTLMFWISVTNPLSTILLVSQYRNALIPWRMRRASVFTSHVALTSTNKPST